MKTQASDSPELSFSDQHISEAGGLECEAVLDIGWCWGFPTGHSLGLLGTLDCTCLSVMESVARMGWEAEESHANTTHGLVALPSCRRSHWCSSHVTVFIGLCHFLDCCCWYQVQWDRSVCRKPWYPRHSWKPWPARQRWERWCQRRPWTSRYCMEVPTLSSGTGTCF